MKVGIVGLPNVGKSTLFAALTEAQVDCANYPFCTIEPNKAIVAVPDERLEKLATLENSEKILPTTIEFMDIAGLVKGAHKGEGLGNKFLSNIREVDAIVHLVRAFENSDITHVAGRINPEEDKEIILLELILADLDYLQKQSENITKKSRMDKDVQAKLQVINKIITALENEKLANSVELNPEEKEMVKELQLLTQKPLLTVYNTTDPSVSYPSAIRELSVCLNVQEEYEITQLPKEERQEFRDQPSGLEKLIQLAYQKLELITFLTTGPQETRAWTIKKGTYAPQAAGRIHTDFQRGFIKAEVIAYEKLLEAGGYAGAREKGWLRLEGKNYLVQDGDVIIFKFNV